MLLLPIQVSLCSGFVFASGVQVDLKLAEIPHAQIATFFPMVTLTRPGDQVLRAPATPFDFDEVIWTAPTKMEYQRAVTAGFSGDFLEFATRDLARRFPLLVAIYPDRDTFTMFNVMIGETEKPGRFCSDQQQLFDAYFVHESVAMVK